MAPAKRGTVADAPVVAKGPASQRSISSFFGSKPAPSKKKSPKKEAPRVSPDSEKDHLKPLAGGAVENQDELDCSPVSMRSNGAEKNGGSSGKSKNWVSTPSPSEPAKPVKTFGRRDRKTFKSGVVAPVPTSTDPPAEKASNLESVVGKRLKVYWPLDKVWYRGRVKSYNRVRGSHVIRYDDGEEESIVLAKEKVKWEDEDEAEAGQNSARKRTLRASTKPDSPPAMKRKKIESDVENEDSLLDELRKDDEDEVQSHRSGDRKRAHLDSQDDHSPAKAATVCTDVYEDADIAFTKAEEGVKVRRRLRKAAKRAPEIKNDDIEMEGEGSEEGKRPQKKAATSVRRLDLDEVDRNGNLPSSESSDDPHSDSKMSLHKKSVTTAPDARDGKPALSKNSQAKGFFSRLDGKPSKSANGGLNPSSEKPISPIWKDKSIEVPAVQKADMRTKGELHSTLVGEAAERFGGRVEEKFKFLGKGRRDGAGRRPSDPDYDPRTVLLPQDFLKGLSGGQRQWWELKSKHMDKVLLFKMGKFYEMYEMDAHTGTQELDLQYMKGDQPHCGFPEKLYSINAEKLAHKGYRVLVVEQTETPDQLEQRKKDTGTKDKVVRREVCAILTKGTIVDGEMLLTHPDAAYLMSITEMPLPSEEPSVTPDHAVSIGVCFVDTSTSHIMLGQFIDDVARSRLCSVLSELRPVEVIKPRGILSVATERAIKDHTRHPLINALIPGREFWDARQSLEEILKVYVVSKIKTNPNSANPSKSAAADTFSDQLHLLPKTLRDMADAGSRGEAALSAIGGCLFYLREALLDRTILMLGRIDLLPCSDPISTENPVAVGCEHDATVHSENEESENSASVDREHIEPYMVMDSAALENLEIIENNRDGGHSGTLFAHLDNCVTPYGRRMLKQWLVRPLLRVEPILQRQQAVLDLKGVAADAALKFRAELKGQADMERMLARLHASSGATGRNGENVVLYEDAAKKQLQEFMGALRGCRALLQARKKFETCLSKLTSDRLRKLVTPGLGVPDMTQAIEHFETAFDRQEAERTGRIIPHEGVDENFDEGDSMVKAASEKLADFLAKQRKKFNNSSEINYVTVGKEAYLMELPDTFHAKLPPSYEMRSSRKGFHRYYTPQIKELLQDLTAGEQQRQTALRGILQGLVKRFCEDSSKWLALVKAIGEVDVLISLSEATIHSGPTCQPILKESPSHGPNISAKEIRHPTVSDNLARGGAFVPNDVALGGTGPPFMLLTGPNMGGKSTLIRQVCLAVVMAQIGANVTAAQFELSPVDRVFVRMGAKDHIMAGQSTFLVELSETAFMLRSATARSLVALDELGRGTSTSDGQAIAHSVLQHLAHNVGCRGMFSTHYHRLAAHFASNPKVGLHHMACKVGTGADGVEEVIFLYKLSEGACPKSYGVNVARLAGMPESVLSRAAARSSELEHLWGSNAHCKPLEEAVSIGAEEDAIGSEKEITLVKEVVGLLKKVPDDAASETFLQIWHEAKQILRNNGNCREGDLDVEERPGQSVQ